MQKKIIISILLVVITLFLIVIMPINAMAYNYTRYSGVMEDLQTDSAFDVSMYPDIPNDHSLQVIQIAESVNGELYVYVYQPSAASKVLTASSIAISTGVDFSDRKYSDLKLTLLSMQGVFHKYKVENFDVASTETRNYAISEIFRPYDSSIDPAPSDDNTITHKAYAVGQKWTVRGFGESVKYECVYEDVMKIPQKHVGFIRYEGGIFNFKSSVDSHYVAFSTDHKIDELLEVDVKFNVKTVTQIPSNSGIALETTEFEKLEEKTLYAAEVLAGRTEGIFPESYEYNRIQSIKVFLKNEGDDLKNNIADDIKDMQWVIRFYESSYVDTLIFTPSSGFGTYTGKYEHTRVTEVAMYRMEFLYDGEIYNLGVVDDKRSGDANPDNKQGWNLNFDFDSAFGKLMAVVLLILLLVALSVIFPVAIPVFKIIIKAFVTVLQLLLSILTFPLRLIFKRRSKK